MVSTPVLNSSNCPPSPSQYVKRKEILIMKSFFCIRPWSIPLNTVNKSFIYQTTPDNNLLFSFRQSLPEL